MKRLPLTLVARATLFLLAFSVLGAGTVSSQDGPSECVTVDFETLPEGTPEEGLLIENQFLDSLGISFSLEIEGGGVPRLAEVGPPETAFRSSFGADTPAPDQNVGVFFLTDDGVTSGLVSPPLIVTFTSPADSASGSVLDIDFNETFTIDARGESDQILETVTVSAGDEGTGDGLATTWSFKREDADVYSIRFEGTRTAAGFFGLGFDNFTTCVPSRVTSTQNGGQLRALGLRQNYPNPFHSTTVIEYDLVAPTAITLKIYDLLGREQATLVSGRFTAGTYQVQWDAGELPSGVYFVRLVTDQQTETRRVTIQH